MPSWPRMKIICFCGHVAWPLSCVRLLRRANLLSIVNGDAESSQSCLDACLHSLVIEIPISDPRTSTITRRARSIRQNKASSEMKHSCGYVCTSANVLQHMVSFTCVPPPRRKNSHGTTPRRPAIFCHINEILGARFSHNKLTTSNLPNHHPLIDPH